jgi:Type VI secretion system/phage-baseplate injector OB domain
VFWSSNEESNLQFPGLYVGSVEQVAGDPDTTTPDGVEFGAIKVTIPSILDLDTPEFALWARPCFPYGHFFVPEKQDKVWIAFENGNPGHPVWLGIWYPKGKIPEEAKANPAKRRVIRSSTGHLISLDDEEGKVIIRDANENTITLDKQGVMIQDANENTITLDAQGITLTDRTGATLKPDSLKIWLNGFTDVFKSWTPVATDGGAALKTAIGTYLTSNPLPL